MVPKTGPRKIDLTIKIHLNLFGTGKSNEPWDWYHLYCIQEPLPLTQRLGSFWYRPAGIVKILEMKAFTILTLLFVVAGAVSVSAKSEAPDEYELVSTELSFDWDVHDMIGLHRESNVHFTHNNFCPRLVSEDYY